MYAKILLLIPFTSSSQTRIPKLREIPQFYFSQDLPGPQKKTKLIIELANSGNLAETLQYSSFYLVPHCLPKSLVFKVIYTFNYFEILIIIFTRGPTNCFVIGLGLTRENPVFRFCKQQKRGPA